MAQKEPVKRTRRPGLVGAAKALGVSYQHLWRVAISGERPGKSLLKRYKEYKKTGVVASAGAGIHANSPKPPPWSISLAAAQNLSAGFLAVLSALGNEVVIVAFQWKPATPMAAGDHPGIMGQLCCQEELDAALVAARAGNYDSTYYDLGQVWHFFHVRDLATAMQILKDAVAARGLLPRATIMHVEGHNEIRTWYPPTADKIEC